MKKIQKIVNYFHPKAKFGHYGETDDLNQYDFVLMSIPASRSMDKMRRKLQEAKELPTKLFVQIQVDDDDAAIIPQIMQTIQELGITNYGIHLSKDFYSFFSESHIKNKVANGMLAGIGG